MQRGREGWGEERERRAGGDLERGSVRGGLGRLAVADGDAFSAEGLQGRPDCGQLGAPRTDGPVPAIASRDMLVTLLRRRDPSRFSPAFRSRRHNGSP